MAADDITLLIAAPSPLTRETLRRLSGTGRTVLRAATLAEALALHAARRPHVVIIDADLQNPAGPGGPGGSGGPGGPDGPGSAHPATRPAEPSLTSPPPPPPYDAVPPPVIRQPGHRADRGPVLDLVRAIRAERGDEDVFLIVLTEPEDHDLRNEALALGANDALRLPLEPPELDARVAVGARQARMARRLRSYSDRLSREMARVAELQMRLLPSSSPYLPGLHVESLYRPSGDASGDYFDYFLLPQRTGNGTSGSNGPVLRVVIADVSGHGARAAFLMSIVRTLVRAQNDGAAARQADGMPPQPLTETVHRINRHLVDIIGGEPDFVTLFAGDIDFSTGTLEYVNAGHCPALLRDGAGGVDRLPSNAPLLGFFSADFTAERRPFPPGSQLLLFTDGLHDWTVHGGARLGPERFLALTEPCLRAGRDVLAAMEAALHDAAGGAPPPFRDDVTALWIRREGPVAGKPAKPD
ncbi:PP2C family protein-serine/threonine phosphatase [Nitratidesulfovibrio sp. HK-II]|nr:serine phosphatase RsbU [Nitratidesulfovibrio sp. HK-II]